MVHATSISTQNLRQESPPHLETTRYDDRLSEILRKLPAIKAELASPEGQGVVSFLAPRGK